MMSSYKRLYLTGARSPKFYGPPKVQKEWMLLRPNSIKQRGSNIWDIQRAVRIPETPGGKIILPCTEQPRISKTTRRHPTWSRWNHHVIWCKSTLHLSAHPTCTNHHWEAPWRRSWTPARNIHDSETHHLYARILLKEHILHFPEQILWAGGRSCHGLSHQPYSDKFIYGKPRSKSHQHITTSPFDVEEVFGWHICSHQSSPQTRVIGTY